MYDQPPPIVHRWRLSTTLRTLSPLHIGDGEVLKIATRAIPEHLSKLRKANPDFASVFTDVKNEPMIPATSLKGALLGWAQAHQGPTDMIRAIFGTQSGAGKIIFADAPLHPPAVPQNREARFWCPQRKTALTPQVVLNSARRSAEEGLLYYREYVPEGTTFDLTITGQNTTEAQRAYLLFVLENAFSSTHRPARLGATGANGWGAISLGPIRFERLDMAAWLRGPIKPWHQAMTPLPSDEEAAWKSAARTYSSPIPTSSATFNVNLSFEGRMLVNDPTRCRKGDEQGLGAISHAMIRLDATGQPFIPARSVRGAFRAQARRVWQTLSWDHPANLNGLHDDSELVRRSGEQANLAGFHALFGATGWRSPIEVSDFVLQGKECAELQEFVAVDRFTGGAASQKKFNAFGLVRPAFQGEIKIRADRFGSAGVGPWAWLFLAFVLRDWIEGDGTLGFGASKGYGAFRASLTPSGIPIAEADLLRRVVNGDALAFQDPRLPHWEAGLISALTLKGAA